MLKIKGYSLIETIPYSAKDRVLAFWVRQVGRPNVRAFTYIGRKARRMVAIYIKKVANPVCIDCGSWIPWEEAVQVRLDSKRAYVCQGCFRSYAYRNPIRPVTPEVIKVYLSAKQRDIVIPFRFFDVGYDWVTIKGNTLFIPRERLDEAIDILDAAVDITRDWVSDPTGRAEHQATVALYKKVMRMKNAIPKTKAGKLTRGKI